MLMEQVAVLICYLKIIDKQSNIIVYTKQTHHRDKQIIIIAMLLLYLKINS